MTLLWSICAWFCVCVYCLFGGLTAPTTLAQRGLWVMKKWQWWLPGNWLLWGGRKGSVPTETSSKWNESKKEAKCKTSDDKSSAEVNASEETWCVCRKTYGFLKVSELKSIYCILYMKHYKLLYLYLAMILMDTFGIFLGTFMYISTDLIINYYNRCRVYFPILLPVFSLAPHFPGAKVKEMGALCLGWVIGTAVIIEKHEHFLHIQALPCLCKCTLCALIILVMSKAWIAFLTIESI